MRCGSHLSQPESFPYPAGPGIRDCSLERPGGLGETSRWPGSPTHPSGFTCQPLCRGPLMSPSCLGGRRGPTAHPGDSEVWLGPRTRKVGFCPELLSVGLPPELARGRDPCHEPPVCAGPALSLRPVPRPLRAPAAPPVRWAREWERPCRGPQLPAACPVPRAGPRSRFGGRLSGS